MLRRNVPGHWVVAVARCSCTPGARAMVRKKGSAWRRWHREVEVVVQESVYEPHEQLGHMLRVPRSQSKR